MALGTWLIGLLDTRVPKRPLIVWGPIGAGLAYMLFLLHPGPVAILPIFFAVSICSACSVVPVLAFLATAVSNDLRGRVYSFINAIDAVGNMTAYTVFATIGLFLPPAGLLAIAGLVFMVGIPVITAAFQGARAMREHEDAQRRIAEDAAVAQASAQ